MPEDGPRAGPGSAPRLHSSEEIGRVRTEGSRLRGERVIVFLAPGAGPSRAAWVAGRRVGGAVARNRARRLLREAWWLLASRVRDGHDLVLVARQPLEGAKSLDVVREIEALLTEAGVMRA